MEIHSYRLLSEFIKGMDSPVWLGVRRNIDYLLSQYGASYAGFSEDILGLSIEMGLDAHKCYATSTMLYMKDQVRLEATGAYNNGSFDEIRSKIYENRDLMETVYLPGMLLSYPFAAMLYTKYDFFLQSYLKHSRSEAKGLDIGFGPGFYIWQILRSNSKMYMRGYDISRYSVDFASRLLESAKIPKSSYELKLGNICDGLNEEDESYDLCTMTEVLEHLPDPSASLMDISRILKKGGTLFLTTVIDSNHYDHLVNFDTDKSVDFLLESTGYEIVHKKCFVVSDEIEAIRDSTKSLMYVCRKRAH